METTASEMVLDKIIKMGNYDKENVLKCLDEVTTILDKYGEVSACVVVFLYTSLLEFAEINSESSGRCESEEKP